MPTPTAPSRATRSTSPLDPIRKAGTSRAFLEKLAESIKTVGLLHPPASARSPVPTVTRWSGGRQRIKAVREVLGWDAVEVKVVEGGDGDGDDEMAAISENLCFAPLTKIETLSAVRRLALLYAEKHPDHVGSGKAGAKAANAKRWKRTPQTASDDPSAPESPPVDEPPPSLASLVAEATGKGLRTASHSIRIARAFDDDEIAALDAHGADRQGDGGVGRH